MRSKHALQEFARRDWSLPERVDLALQRGKKRTALAKLEMADLLRQHVHALRPDWPSREERLADLLTHVRVTEALRRVATGKKAVVRRKRTGRRPRK